MPPEFDPSNAPDPAPQPADPAAADPAPDPEPEPQFDPQAAYGHLVGQVDELRNVVSQYFAPGGGYAAPDNDPGYAQPQYTPDDDFDPFDRGSLGSVIASEVEKAIGPLQQALAPIVQQHQDRASEEYVNGAFERMGVPDQLRDEVLIMSGGYRLAGQSPEQAIASAYNAIRGLTGSAQSQGRQEQRDELETIVSAPGVARSTQPGAVPAERRATSMEEAAMRIASRMGIGG